MIDDCKASFVTEKIEMSHTSGIIQQSYLDGIGFEKNPPSNLSDNHKMRGYNSLVVVLKGKSFQGHKIT